MISFICVTEKKMISHKLRIEDFESETETVGKGGQGKTGDFGPSSS